MPKINQTQVCASEREREKAHPLDLTANITDLPRATGEKTYAPGFDENILLVDKKVNRLPLKKTNISFQYMHRFENFSQSSKQ